jgi:hypothetical protein
VCCLKRELAVPRYFFHITDGEEIIDHEGTELADIDSARAEAVVLSGGDAEGCRRKFFDNTASGKSE